jgi:hypothetical protein
MIPLAEGAMMRRPGTRYVHALADQTKRGRLMRFEFSNTQAYPLVVEEEAIRFNRNQGRILVADTDAAISNGDFATDLTDWDDQSTGSASIVWSGGTLTIDRTLGTAIGDMTAGGGLAAAFDGTTSQGSGACAAKATATSATIGKDWGAGNKQVITGFKFYGSNNNGTVSAINPTVTLTLQGSSDNFVSDTNNLGSLVHTDTADESAGREQLTGIDTTTAYQYHRILVTHNGAANGINCAEVVLYKGDPAGDGYMNLVGNSSDIAWAEQDVTATATGTEHVLAFRVIGTQGDTLQLSIGTTSTGGELINDVEYGIGWHVVAFTPMASPFYVQFKNPSDYTVGVDDVSILDNQHLVLTTPYAEADLQALYPVQSADVMYLFHEDYPTYKLLRFGHTSWSLQRVAWEDGPWLTQNSTTTTATPSATSGRSITVTFSSALGINGDTGFSTDDIGRLLRIDNPATGVDWGWGIITAVTTSKIVTVAVVDSDRPFATTNADVNWRLGAWSDGTGWPRCGVFFEQRLFAGGSTDRTQNFVASQTSDFENMSPDSPTSAGVWDGTVEDDDSFDYTLSSNQVDAIVSMSASADDMFILTSGGAWRPTSSGATMTPTDISVRRQVSSAAASAFPLVIDNIVLFVQRGLRKIRELGFNFEVDGYRAIDMTRLAQHMTRGKIREIAYQEEPESQVYALLENGKLPAMTFRREEDVVGWARHILGGAFSSGDAVVESVVTTPGNDGVGQTFDSTERDEVWLIVKRTINGGTKRYVEFMERPHDSGDHDVEDAFYVDSGLTYDGSADDTITGLDHLEGQTVKVWADGDLHDDRTVSGGSITLAAAASVVQVGLAYKHKLRNLKSEGGAAAGTAVTKRKRIVKMGFVLLDARRFSYGPTSSDLTTLNLSTEADYSGGLFTGEVKRDWPDGWKDDPRVYIEGDDPSPFILLALSPETDTKDFV